MDVQLQEDGGIPVVPFLEACKSVLTIFGKIFIILINEILNSNLQIILTRQDISHCCGIFLQTN